MSHPLAIPGARICILRYPSEVTVCANVAGFQALGQWIAWLAMSNPEENFHFHLLWHLESEASRFEGAQPKNVWFLSQLAQPSDGEAVEFELTFQVVGESDLDELAKHQATGTVPARFQKHEPSLVAHVS